jgi:cupin 2 domain-containing protein
MNILSNIPKDLPEELIEVLAENDKVRIERIVSAGHISADWYDQNTNEFVLLFKGEAKILFEEGAQVVHLKAGDHCAIPAHARHKVIWTIPNEHTVWLAVHY